MKKKLLTESQMRRMAAIAGIPALGNIVGRLSEKLDIQTEDGHEEEKAVPIKGPYSRYLNHLYQSEASS